MMNGSPEILTFSIAAVLVTVGAGPEATTSSDAAPSPVYLARSVTPLYFALMHASQIYNTNKYSTNKKEEEEE